MKKQFPIRFFAWLVACFLIVGCAFTCPGAVASDRILHRTVDLRIGEAQEVRFFDGTAAHLELLHLQEIHDEVNDAVREAKVQVEVNGQATTLTSGTYHLPVTFGGVQLDCPITKGYLEKAGGQNPWGLLKDARLRIWPPGSSWIVRDTFVYPAKQRWFASYTQMANEPVYVDGGDLPAKKEIYYHFGLDMGGSEGLVDVVSATEGTVTSSGNEVLA